MKVQKVQKISVAHARRESAYLIPLRHALQNQGISSDLYSLDGYAEDRICIEKARGYWSIYTGSRGRKLDEKRLASPDAACVALIKKVADSDEQERMTLRNYRQLVRRIF